MRFVRFHGMRSHEDLFPAEPTIESFLTDLAVHRHVAAATQHQAMHALVFLDTRVLNHALPGRINAVCADKKITVPVVMTRVEVTTVISLLDGTAQVVAKLLYGSGLRIMEAVRLRVKDIDSQMKPLTVRSGKGDKDRFTTVPATLTGGHVSALVHRSPGNYSPLSAPPARAIRRTKWPAPASSQRSTCHAGRPLQ